MNYYIDLQHVSSEPLPFTEDQIMDWAKGALNGQTESAELTIRIVDKPEMQSLNKTFRGQDKPTNVLAFPANLPANIALEYPLLGDIIVCPSVLLEESLEQHKSLQGHWAHIIIHGILHLLGYDHIKDDDAAIMQELEKKLLSQIGVADPYEVEDTKIE